MLDEVMKRIDEAMISAPKGWPVQLQEVVAELLDEIERLRKIEAAASSLAFSTYPAHGSGFVMVVSGDIAALQSALHPLLQMGEDLRPTSKA